MGDLAYYDPANDQWRCYGKGKWVGYYHTMAADPKRQKLVAVGKGVVFTWDISDTSVSALDLDTIATSGDNTIINANNPGVAYDPVTDRIVAWGSSADVYTLNMDNMVWAKQTLAPTNTVIPTSPNQNGTYGRFRYVPDYNVFVLANNTNENVFIYRLSDDPGSVDALPGQVNIRSLRISCRPNPFRGRVAISCQLSAISKKTVPIQIYDVNGKIVKELTTDSRQLTTGITWTPADIPNGVYLIKLRYGNNSISKKVMLVR
jgi:hypothetical protein